MMMIIIIIIIIIIILFVLIVSGHSTDKHVLTLGSLIANCKQFLIVLNLIERFIFNSVPVST